MTKGKFYYFGFGSNLLERRIKIQNPSAQRYAVGKLKGYRLDFADSSVDKIYYSQTWNGVPATIIEDANSLVYGAVWTIDNDQIEELDKQEGVECGIYKPLILKVLIDNDEKEVSCRSYQLVHNPRMLQEPHERPFERQPSKTYLMGKNVLFI